MDTQFIEVKSLEHEVNSIRRAFVERLIQDDRRFDLMLKAEGGESQHIVLSFDNPVCTRSTDEGYRLAVQQQFPDDVFGLVFQVLDSSFLQWLMMESDFLYADVSLKHFVVFTDNMVVDVITDKDPKLERVYSY